jgi:hypothetical protein
MTPEEIAGLRKMLAEATPGVWVAIDPPKRKCAAVLSVQERESLYVYLNVNADMTQETLDRWQADARLIAKMHSALPSLLDEVERLKLTLLHAEMDRDVALAKLSGTWPNAKIEELQEEVATLREIADAAREVADLSDPHPRESCKNPVCAAIHGLRAALRKGGRS